MLSIQSFQILKESFNDGAQTKELLRKKKEREMAHMLKGNGYGKALQKNQRRHSEPAAMFGTSLHHMQEWGKNFGSSFRHLHAQIHKSDNDNDETNALSSPNKESNGNRVENYTTTEENSRRKDSDTTFLIQDEERLSLGSLGSSIDMSSIIRDNDSEELFKTTDNNNGMQMRDSLTSINSSESSPEADDDDGNNNSSSGPEDDDKVEGVDGDNSENSNNINNNNNSSNGNCNSIKNNNNNRIENDSKIDTKQTYIDKNSMIDDLLKKREEREKRERRPSLVKRLSMMLHLDALFGGHMVDALTMKQNSNNNNRNNNNNNKLVSSEEQQPSSTSVPVDKAITPKHLLGNIGTRKLQYVIEEDKEYNNGEINENTDVLNYTDYRRHSTKF